MYKGLALTAFLHRDRPAMLTTSARPVVRMNTWPVLVLVLVGMVDGCGYNGQQKDTIRNIRGPCQTIRSTFKLVFLLISTISYTYELLRCLDVEIW